MPQMIRDIGALEETLNQLRQIKDALDSVKDDVNSYDADLGSERLEDALERFVDGWRDGRKKILGSLEGTVKRLEAAIAEYESLEREIVEATGRR